jgi:hypothetical protein
VYDMYPWDSASPEGRHPETGASSDTRPGAIKAVQIALDRRDNGGDATDATDAVGAASTPPAGPTRQ